MARTKRVWHYRCRRRRVVGARFVPRRTVGRSCQRAARVFHQSIDVLTSAETLTTVSNATEMTATQRYGLARTGSSAGDTAGMGKSSHNRELAPL